MNMNFWGILIGLILISLGIGAVFGVNVWKYFFPILLILFGLSILSNQSGRKGPWTSMSFSSQPSEVRQDTLNYSVSFSEGNIRVTSDNFTGGKVSAAFAGVQVDLRNAKIPKNGTANLEVSAAFSGVKVIVPRSWEVEASLSGAFGGFTNTTVAPQKPEGKLVVKGSATFGGGQITN